MTNVSKQLLSVGERKKLFDQFSVLFIDAGEKQIARVFVELFTESEQIMFIKRVGIIFMLKSECSSYEIAKTLLVSQVTVQSIKQNLLNDKYDCIVGVMKRKTFNREKFWQVIETVLRAGLPPRGKGRWKPVLEMLKQ